MPMSITALYRQSCTRPKEDLTTQLNEARLISTAHKQTVIHKTIIVMCLDTIYLSLIDNVS